jgi:hypothetical protein
MTRNGQNMKIQRLFLLRGTFRILGENARRLMGLASDDSWVAEEI